MILPTDPLVRQLTESSLGTMATVLARAFQQDAGTMFFEPDPMARAGVLPVFFTVMTRFALAHGEAHGIGEPLAGVALWLPPGFHATAEDMQRAGIDALITAFEPEAAERFERVGAALDELHARTMHEPNWDLFFLGVAPEAQGQGLGVRLLAPMIDRIRADGRPAYTATFEERNVPFYQRTGFEITLFGSLADTALPVWSFRLGQDR